jgi:tetratricopeptide (TPR) repeat protein
LSRSYEFRTPLAREVILDTIGPADRLELHETAAEAVLQTTLAPDRFKEAVAAEHYDEAAMPEKALENYREAGARANRLYDHDDAVDFYERALDLADALDREEAALDILEALSRVQYCKGDAGAAARTLERLLDRTEDPERIQSVELARWRMAKDQGNFDDADEYARSGIEVLDEPSPLTCRFWGKLGWTELQRGNVEDAVEYFDHQEALVEEVDDEVSQGDLYYNRAHIAKANGDLEAAIDLAEQAVLYHNRGGSDRDIAKDKNLIGMSYNEMQNNRQAENAYEECGELIDDIGDRVLEVYLDSNQATCPINRGEWSAALDQIEQTIDLARTLDQKRVLVRLLTNSSWIYSYRGELVEARTRAEEAVEMAQSTDEVVAIAMANIKLSIVKLFEHSLDSAQSLAISALERSEDVLPSKAAESNCRIGDIEIAKANFQSACDSFQQARQKAIDCNSTDWKCYAKAGCAAALLAQGESKVALEDAKQAATEAKDCSNPEVLCYVHLVLARCLGKADEMDDAFDEIDAALEIAREVDATLLESRALLERGRLKRQTNTFQAVEQLRAALDLATAANADLLEDQCRTALDRLRETENIDQLPDW